MVGQTDASMIEFEEDMDGIVETDNSKTVNTTETENSGGSATKKTVTQETPAQK